MRFLSSLRPRRLSLALAVASLTACMAIPTQAQQQPPRPLPTETDTVRIAAGAVLAPVAGEIWVQRGDGPWARLDAPIRPTSATRLLVASGAAFMVGRATIGPESHGDRLVVFAIAAPPTRAEETPTPTVRTAPLIQGGENCVTSVGATGVKTTCKTPP